MEKQETISNTSVIENAGSKNQVLDLVQDVAYVVPKVDT